MLAGRWVRLRAEQNKIIAQTAEKISDWRWLVDYLQLEANLAEILSTFPQDAPMQAAVKSCPGLRLLRQEPWECLASFICSSTKQIVQIQQIIAALCEKFGEPVSVPAGHEPAFSFPSYEKLAPLSEADLRGCKMGFRAPYLLNTAKKIVAGEINLSRLFQLQLKEARLELIKFPGVGVKVADCVLLFGFGFDQAFPVDVWIMKALQQLYFPRRRASLKKLRHFSETHFGPHAGYAQQYLFHYMRTKNKLVAAEVTRL